jgi:short coiled-coil protein
VSPLPYYAPKLAVPPLSPNPLFIRHLFTARMVADAGGTVSRHAKALQESLLMIFNRIEAVKEEHDKLDSNNKFLQKYIGDLMSTSKITATSSSRAKK